MLKNLKNISHEENKKMFAQGTSFATWCANHDKELYEKYKNNQVEKLEDYQKEEIKVLSLLDKLGYPMDELGTYLYKDVIKSTCKNLNEIIETQNMEKYEELIESLNDAYSDFYRWISRDYLEMGVSSFHLYIEKALLKIDLDRCDKPLLASILGEDPEDINYGEQALQIASYLLNMYSIRNAKISKDVFIMRLSNLPTNIKLKED